MIRWIRVLVALVALHALAVFPNPAEDIVASAAWLRPSPDLLLLLALGSVAVLAFGFRRPMAHAMALCVLFVPLYRVGVTLLPMLYGRPFKPHVDLLEAPALVHLLLHAYSVPVQWLLGAAAGILAGGLYWLVYQSCAAVLRACTNARFAGGLLVVSQLAVVLGFVIGDRNLPNTTLWRTSSFEAALDDVATMIRTRDWRVGEVFAERAQTAARELAATPQDLARLANVDVYVLFIESYGRGVLGNRARPEFERWLMDAETELHRHDLHAASGWIQPTVRGGGSVFSHAELFSGIVIEDRRYLDTLLASDAATLPAILRAHGYHTVDVQPGMPRAWPEAAMLGFEQDVFRPAFDYDGIRYHWGDMPDQRALQHVLRHVVRQARKPLFVHFVSVTSHSPFAMVPPYFTDWSRAGQPGAYAGPPRKRYPITWMNYTKSPQVEAAYLATIHYGLRTAVGFACQLKRPSLVWILGDHQPPLRYTDRPGRLHDVPMHVITNRPELLTHLSSFRLRDGMLPDFDGRGFPSTRFVFRFLRAFSGTK